MFALIIYAGILNLQLQRPGVDDVMVLKKELVSVQTLMDQMTQESEKKSKEVENDRQHLQNLLDEAKQQAEVVQREFDLFRVSSYLFSHYFDMFLNTILPL